MPSQRPYFLSSFLAAFRPQGPSLPTTPPQHQQPNKHSHTHSHAHAHAHAHANQTSSATTSSPSTARATTSSQPHANVAIHSPRAASASTNVASGSVAGIPIPSSNRRRGSDSSSEGFREVLGADKWYIGGRTPGGEEKFFKMGVIRRVRSNDGLSLDRLSL